MLSVDRPSTECRPITDRLIGQVSTNYRPSIGEVSARCRRNVGERKAISAETHLEGLSAVSRPSVDRLSTDYRPLYRPTVDRVSTDYRPSVDRLSTECRPLYRPISTHSKQDPRNLYSTGAGVHTHTPVTNTQRFAITFWKGKIIQGFKLEQIVK